VRSLLDEIEGLSDSLVFIDEADSLFRRRNPAKNPYDTQLVDILLGWLDGLETRNDMNVVLAMATNMIKEIDPAVKSRCQLLSVPLPSSQLREQWWARNARQLKKEDCSELARAMPGASFRDLEQVAVIAEQAAASLRHSSIAPEPLPLDSYLAAIRMNAIDYDVGYDPITSIYVRFGAVALVVTLVWCRCCGIKVNRATSLAGQQHYGTL